MQSFVRGIHVQNGKILALYQTKWNLWVPPGGVIESDEDPEDALFREIEEEIGVDDVSCSHMFRGEMTFTNIVWMAHFYLFTFVGSPYIKEPDKHRAMDYKYPHELHPKYIDIVKEIIR